MSGKSHRNRGGDRDRGDDYPRKQSSNQEAAKSRAVLDEFFLDGEGIDREVLQSSICRFLGPEATSRPHEHEGRKGFKIRAIRTFTPAMLQDLKERSAEFESESQSSRRGHGGPLRYEDSLTMRRQDVTGADSMDYESSHPMPIYTPGQSNPAYAAQYPSDPAMYPYGNPSHQSNSYANPYTTTYASNTGIPAYTDNRAFPSDYPYQGPREGLQGQQYGYSQGYGEMPPRRPDPGYPGYMDPTRPSIPGQGQPYTIPNQPPRMFDDPNAPGYPYPRSTNQPFSSQYPPPGGAGPAQYGDNSRDTRDGRQREQPRDSYDRPSDYRSGRR